jgi:hypothetical protein
MPTPIELYRAFHGRRKAPWTAREFHIPRALIFLGQAVSIVYLSNKRNGGGDGKLCEYEHEFETPVDLYMDERGKHQLYLLGRRLVVTSDGIQN